MIMSTTKVKTNALQSIKNDERVMNFIVPTKKVNKDYEPGTIYQVNGKTGDYLIIILQNSYEQQQILGFPIYKYSTVESSEDYIDIKEHPEKINIPTIGKISIEESYGLFIDFGRIHTLKYSFIGQYVNSIKEYFISDILPNYGKFLHITDNLSKENDSLKESFEEALSKIKNIEEKSSEKQNKINAHCKTIYSLRQKIEKLTNEKDTLNEELQILNGNIDRIVDDQKVTISKYEDQIEKLKSSIKEADHKLKRYESSGSSTVEDLQSTINFLETENERLKNKNESLMVLNQEYADKLQNGNAININTELQFYKGKVEAYENMLKAMLTNK